MARFRIAGIRLALASCCILGAAFGRGVAGVPVREIETTASEKVTLTAPTGIHLESSIWVELSGPDILLARGEVEAPTLTITPRTPGDYLFAYMGPPGLLARASFLNLHVAPSERHNKPEYVGEISGPILVGAGDEVYLLPSLRRIEHLAASDEPLAVRWKQLSGPRLALSRTELREPRLRLKPVLPGRYRFGARLLSGAGWTPMATFTFELPTRPDGRADRRPSAWVDYPAKAKPGEQLLLDASRSIDPDGDELRFRWDKISGPEGPLPVCAEGARFRFLPLVAGEYILTLTTIDPFGLESAPFEVRITVGLPVAEVAHHREPEDPLDRPFTVKLEDAPLDSLLARLSYSGVSVRASGEVALSETFRSMRLDLWVVELPARKVLDWLGRMLGAFYVVEEKGSVWYARDTTWLEREEPRPVSFEIDALFPSGQPGGLVAFLTESVRAALWASKAAAIGPVDATRGTLHASLQDSARGRIARIIEELRREHASGPPSLEGPDPTLLCRRVRVNWKNWNARDAIWDLARQGRVPIGWSPGDLPKAKQVTLELGETTLKEALDALCRELGFDGYMLEQPGAIWLVKGAPPDESSECAWSSAEVRSYDVRMILAANGWSGQMLVHLVKRRVRPTSWADPFVAIGYVEARGRLVVIHKVEVQREVGAFLERLARKGQRALAE